MNGSPTLADYFSDIYERKMLVIITVATAMAFALAFSRLMPPVFEAKTAFYAPINVSPPSYVGPDVSTTLGQTPFMPPSEEKLASAGVGILRSRDVFRKIASEFPQLSPDVLRKNTDIKVSREFMLEVYVRNRDPKLAADIANRFPLAYREFNATQIKTYMAGIRDAALRELSAVELRIASLRGRASSDGGEPAAAKYLIGSTDDRLRLTAEKLRNVAAESALQAKQPTAPLVIVEQATPPGRPVFPLPILNVVVSGATGLALGCYYALICGMVARARKRRIERCIEMPSLTNAELDALRFESKVAI